MSGMLDVTRLSKGIDMPIGFGIGLPLGLSSLHRSHSEEPYEAQI